MAATEKAQEARVGFEEAARHTVKELGQTVVVSASRAATVTAEEIAAALNERRVGGRLDSVESELRALNTVSRESCERTTAALERVHQTLRVFLGKGPKRPVPRRRGDALAFTRRSRPALTLTQLATISDPSRSRNPGSIQSRCGSPCPPIRTSWKR